MRALPAGWAMIQRAETIPYRIAITPAPIASHSARSVVILELPSRYFLASPAAARARVRRCTAKKARDYTTKAASGRPERGCDWRYPARHGYQTCFDAGKCRADGCAIVSTRRAGPGLHPRRFHARRALPARVREA